MRYVLLGDAQSPHLLKWARALAPQVELWVASSRGFDAGFATLLPSERRLALNTQADHAGGNVGLLLKLPQLGAWLHRIDADCINAHYLTSHGTLAWLAKRLWRLRAKLVGSAWGSDILVAPQQSSIYRWLTRRVLQACDLCTSDSQYMSERMRELGAREVLTFAFGLDSLPPPAAPKQPQLFFANRGLESIYRPQRVLELFAALAAKQPEARLVVANEGSLQAELQAWVNARGLSQQVQFVGRLNAKDQARCYEQAQWYVSLPQSDSVAVSVLEAMAHGCVPLLSDLPANRELVQSGVNGLIVLDGTLPSETDLQPLLARAAEIAAHNRDWVAQHGLFAPAVARYLSRLREVVGA
jgi:glycosyltransferase involved in cell wall biosynthesis